MPLCIRTVDHYYFYVQLTKLELIVMYLTPDLELGTLSCRTDRYEVSGSSGIECRIAAHVDNLNRIRKSAVLIGYTLDL